MVMADTNHRRFGAYTAVPWKSDGKDCYGNGEGFVFTFRNSPGEMRDDTVRNKDNFTVVPKEMQVVKIFPSVPNSNRYFMRSTTSDGLFVGGGDSGSAIHIRPDLLNGSSTSCETFDNEVLGGNERGELKIIQLEVWGLGWRALDFSAFDDTKSFFAKDGDGRSGL